MNGSDHRSHEATGNGFLRLWGAGVIAVIAAAPFAERLATFVPSCPFKVLTGLPCPFCGSTRAALLLAQGRPIEASGAHPLPTLLWGVFLVGGLVAAGYSLSGRPLPRWKKSWHTPALVVGSIVLVTGWAFNVATGV